MSRLERQLGLELLAAPNPKPHRRALPPLPADATANLILVNGRVVTMDAANTATQAVAIHGDRILQAGTDDAIRTLAGSGAKVIDLRGRTVTPRLVDAHNHVTAKGLIGAPYIVVNPPDVSTVAEMQAKIAEGCAQTDPGKWVIAQGYISYEGEYPDKTMLDPVSPNHPVMLINQGGHMGAVNSYALALAGVTAATPDPQCWTEGQTKSMPYATRMIFAFWWLQVLGGWRRSGFLYPPTSQWHRLGLSHVETPSTEASCQHAA